MGIRGLCFRLTVLVVAACIGSASIAGPISVTCVRDQKDDPAKIRALFGQVDRMEVGKLSDANVSFYLPDRGFTAVEEFVRLFNFRDGREDSAPLAISGIRSLEARRPAPNVGSYVVQTRRSAWFDRGSELNNSFTETDNTWLVSFQGCEIKTVREVPEIWYLIDSEDQ